MYTVLSVSCTYFDIVQNSICGFKMQCELHLWSVLFLLSSPNIREQTHSRTQTHMSSENNSFLVFHRKKNRIDFFHLFCFPNSTIHNLPKPVNALTFESHRFSCRLLRVILFSIFVHLLKAKFCV